MDLERRLMRIVVGVACMVPILAGLAGLVLGPSMAGGATVIVVDQDSHFRYLSGLLLGIGLGFMSTIPRIEWHRSRILLLSGIVVVGGLGRLISLLVLGLPAAPMLAALVMELVVTPALCIWQMRLAARVAQEAKPQG